MKLSVSIAGISSRGSGRLQAEELGLHGTGAAADLSPRSCRQDVPGALASAPKKALEKPEFLLPGSYFPGLGGYFQQLGIQRCLNRINF